MTKTVTPPGWNDTATAPKDGTMLHLLIRPGQEDLDAFTSFHDSREPYETIGFNQMKDTLEDVWQFAGWDWCHDCITEGHGEVIGWLPFGSQAPPPQPNLRVDVKAEIASVVQSVNEWDDRTSPDDYPDHLLITSEELTLILRNFAATISITKEVNHDPS